jgi:ABC-type glycerol-3-phosphate transport system substrate-binding protein
MLVQIGGGEAVDAISDLVVTRNSKFADLEPYRQANIRFTELIDSGFFHDNWLNADYSEMFNMFAQGQSPMMFMSTSLTGIDTMPELSPEVKGNISVFPFPAKTGDIGDSNYMKAIFITCYSLSKNAPKEAEDFLYWFMDKNNYAKTSWQLSGALPAQDITSFVSPEDMNSVKGEILNIQNNIKVAAGQSFYELNTASFRSESQDLMHRYWSKMISLDDYLKGLDDAADKGVIEMNAQS